MSKSRSIKAGGAHIEIGADRTKLEKGLLRARQMLRAWGGQVARIGAGITAASTAAATPFAIATRAYAQFDDEMRTVRAVTGATEEQFQALREEAKRLGRETSFSARQVAGAMVEMGRAGFDSGQILQSTQDVLNLARATNTELPRATEIAAAAMRGFNLPASEMGRVADVVATSVNSSSQTLEDYFEAMKVLAPIASAAGESIEQTSAAIGILADNGIKGSLGGNALARAFKNLSSEKVDELLASIGVKAGDAQGNLRPIADIIADIGQATSGMGSRQRLSIFEELFGRGQAAGIKLADADATFDNALANLLSSDGNAERIAKEMDAGIGGAFRRTMSAIEGVLIAVGEAVEGPVTKAAEILANVSGVVTEFVQNNQALVAGVAVGIGVALAAGVTLTLLGGALILAGSALGTLASLVGFILSPLGALIVLTAVATGGIIAAGAGFLFFTDMGQAAVLLMQGELNKLWEIVKATMGGIFDAIKSGNWALAGRIAMLGLKSVFLEGTTELQVVWLKFVGWFGGIWAEMEIAARGFFDGLFTGVTQAYDWVVTKIGNLFLEFSVGLGITDMSEEDVWQEIRDNNTALRGRQSEKDAGLANRDAERQRELEARLALLEIGKGSERATVENEIAEILAELEQLNIQAAEGAEDAPGLGAQTEAAVNSLVNRITGGFAAASINSDRITARGTFAADTRGLGADSSGAALATAVAGISREVEDIRRRLNEMDGPVAR
jgi:TP901 family phage tail tape measure protein